MFKYDKPYNLFTNWLQLSLCLVFTIIIVGGLTRLTGSGLSIIEWELFKGILPPLNEMEWSKYFQLYKTIPQYKLLNFNMTLDEFKIIFYWEYFHRILGRLIGIFFLIPLLYFYLTNQIDKKYLKPCFIIMILIILQGIIGWYMVSSGLVNNVSVSHYRLSLHLSVALIIISAIFWLIINIRKKTFKVFFKFDMNNFPFLILFILLFFQIILGAFVSGLDAGKLYPTWPLMGNAYVPNDFIFKKLEDLFNFNNHSLVQFYHRNLAYLITFYIFIISYYVFIKKVKRMYQPLIILLIFLFFQIFLGIFTLISGINIYLASLHQITSVLLIFSAINFYYSYIK